MSKLRLYSPAFADHAAIPRRYTDDGLNVSPPLLWQGVPQGARELALLLEDPDAPSPTPWVHWVIYRLKPGLAGLPDGVPPSQRVNEPAGALQGRNSWGRIGYGGPAPPLGHGLHHYHFRLYALDTELHIPPGTTKDILQQAMQGHILEQAEWVGTYQR